MGAARVSFVAVGDSGRLRRLCVLHRHRSALAAPAADAADVEDAAGAAHVVRCLPLFTCASLALARGD